MKIAVLAKQVPDTRNVGENAMKKNGTVNRSALPAIFNPEDLNALEQALRIKDKFQETDITLITMGPIRAVDIIRDALYRGINRGYLVTDRKFAGADTLATSYVLAKAIEKTGPYDLILGGRQAIDGDTAQVGPQVAENLNINQITYVEEIYEINKSSLKVVRRLEGGREFVHIPLPALLTVHGSAAPCRPKNALLLMKYKRAKLSSELQSENEDYMEETNKDYLSIINELNADDLGCDTERIGLTGSPTKVRTIENVVFKAKESKILTDSDEDIRGLMKILIGNHTLG